MQYWKLICLSLLSVSAQGAVYTSPAAQFHFTYDDASWEVVPERTEKAAAPDVDKSMAEATLVTVQRKQADEKYHARFSVVSDSLKRFTSTKEPLLNQYQKYALDFLKSQRFQILSTKVVELPKLKEAAIDITASQRDFGLKFRQVIFVRGDRAYLLTVATRTEKFEAYGLETQKFFDSFEFK